ncbi:MAG: hypothetical protein ACI9WU_003937 [Myxococcota bacterium]|jgi:hypothetical protein
MVDRSMVIYEVNLDVDCAIESDYLGWLWPHIDQLLAIDGFEEAAVLQRPSKQPGRFGLTCHYHLRDHDALQAYFDVHAARLRGDGVDRFAGRFEAWRRVLEPLDRASDL